MMPKHPYYPVNISLPHYVPNDKDLSVLLGGMFGGVGLFMAGTWILSGRSKTPRFSTTERMILCWFIMCGLIHTILEGYFSAFHATLAGEMTFLAQVWKEYSKGDSRYLTSDTFVLCMESITAVIDGPLSFLTLIAYFRQSSYRYILQLIVSICQLYGDVLYFMTEIKEGFSHGDPNHPLYFMNLIWIVVPICLIFHAASHLADSQSKADRSRVQFRLTSLISKRSHQI